VSLPEKAEGPAADRTPKTATNAIQAGDTIHRDDDTVDGLPWPEPEGGYKPASKIGTPESAVFTTLEVEAMNDRIAKRLEQAPKGRTVAIDGPRWAGKIVDTGDELLAIHKDTAFPYPLDLHEDLSLEDHCIVVVQRLFLAGATDPEVERVVRAFGLEGYEVARLVRNIREGR
jgi:hypothetical protein